MRILLWKIATYSFQFRHKVWHEIRRPPCFSGVSAVGSPFCLGWVMSYRWLSVRRGMGRYALTSQGRTSRELVCGPEEGGDEGEDKGGKCSSSLQTRGHALVECAAGMEVITEHLVGILSLSQEQDGKEAKRQALLLVAMAKSQANQLVEKYLGQQGPPFSDNGAAVPQAKIEDLPALDQQGLPASPWKRLALSLQAFLSLSEWLAAILLWQRDLNPKSWELLNLLEIAETNSRAIGSNLTVLLGRPDTSAPSPMTPSTTIKKKVAGYMVCKSFYEWLSLTERDLVVLIAESSV